jgi:glycosyltransferase involved in cell wall biosynthesis
VPETVTVETIRNDNTDVAVLVPCYNEAATIARVVSDFRAALPGARICVFDNNSTDDSVARARAAGAEVWFERRQGKGSVVRRMFADIDADVYLMVDGDATYHAASAPLMIETLLSQTLDMVVAKRFSIDKAAYRSGHRTGNRLLTGAVAWIFGRQMTDILSGYRAMSRRFVKSFPAMTEHFGIETELTVHALQLRMPVQEVETPYYARPEGSDSKLNTWSDGFYILGTILRLFVLERPLQFFLIFASMFFLAATVLFVPVLLEYFATGQVLKFPSLIVAVGGYTLAVLCLVIGTLLYTTATGRLEAKRFRYLEIPPPGKK